MEFAGYLIVALFGYLMGSLPTGYLVAKARGVDIRKQGSGNIGATNVFRILGKKAGIFVLFVDALKGFLACWLAPYYFKSLNPETAALVSGIAAILGHNYTVWLKFKGGKGVATSAGVLLQLVPLPLLIIFIVWLIVFGISRYVSLGSIMAAIALPFAVWLTGGSIPMIVIMSCVSALAIYKHRTNITRLLNGTENRIGSKKPDSSNTRPS